MGVFLECLGKIDELMKLLTIAMCRRVIVFVAVVFVISVSAELKAQSSSNSERPWLKGRLVWFANGGMQVVSKRMNDTLTFRAYGEDAKFTSSQEVSGGLLFDLGGSLRVWRAFSIGASYSRLEATDATGVSGTVPHPMNFGSGRAIPTQSLSLDRVEQAGHVFGAWRLPVLDKLDLSFFGGVSLFNAQLGRVTNVVVSEPGDARGGAINVDQIQRGAYKRNGLGGHVGFDITYMLTESIGVGVLARFANASIRMPASGNSSRSVAVGGIQAGGGIRYRF